MTPDELREARLALGLTQQQLADALFVHITTVARWETGAARITNRTAAQVLRMLDD